MFESSPFNWYEGPEKPDLLIVTSGSGWFYSLEAVRALELEKSVGILKLATTWPLPEKLVRQHLSQAAEVLVVEEIDPFLEGNLKELVGEDPSAVGPIKFYGKRSGHIPGSGEINPDIVTGALARILDIEYRPVQPDYSQKALALTSPFTHGRMVGFCAGCPHRATFWSIKNALKLDGRDGFVSGDIGCYSMAVGPTGYWQVKTMQAMGSGTGMACGFGNLAEFGFDQPVVAVCGDSTFYHATIPAMISGIYNRADFTLLILDNSATAMTGFQPHPGTGRSATGEQSPVVDIATLCRALGVRVEETDPFDLEGTKNKLLDLLRDEGGVRVLIVKRECALVRARKEKPAFKMRARRRALSWRELRLLAAVQPRLPVPGAHLGCREGRRRHRRSAVRRLRRLRRHLPGGRDHQGDGVSMERDPLNIIITGVGGQGNVLLSQLVGRVLVRAGFHATIGETYGASQRGGAVMSHLRVSRRTQYGPLIGEGQADVIVGLEPLETLRVIAQYGNPTVAVITNSRPVFPQAVSSGGAKYPTADEIGDDAPRAVEALLGRRCDRHRAGAGAADPGEHRHDGDAGRKRAAAARRGAVRGGVAREPAGGPSGDEPRGVPARNVGSRPNRLAQGLFMTNVGRIACAPTTIC